MKKTAPVRDDEPLMSVGEVSEYIGIPQQTIYRWRVDGRGPVGIRIGRHLRFRRSSVDEWLDANADPAA